MQLGQVGTDVCVVKAGAADVRDALSGSLPADMRGVRRVLP